MKQLIRSEKGATLVEMTFVSIFLLLLIAGIADLGRAFNNYIIITNASREGARYAARMPCNASSASSLKSAIEAAVVREAVNSGIDLSDGALTDIAISPDPESGCPTTGDPVAVTVTYDFATILGGILGSTEIPLRSTTTMLFFGNDQEGGVWPVIAALCARTRGHGNMSTNQAILPQTDVGLGAENGPQYGPTTTVV